MSVAVVKLRMSDVACVGGIDLAAIIKRSGSSKAKVFSRGKLEAMPTIFVVI